LLNPSLLQGFSRFNPVFSSKKNTAVPLTSDSSSRRRPGSSNLLKSLDYSLRSPFGPSVAFNALRAYVPAFAGMTEKDQCYSCLQCRMARCFPVFFNSFAKSKGKLTGQQ